jgi:hypothetical protein
LLEPPPLFGDEIRELLLPLDDGLLATAEFARPAAQLSVALLEDVRLAIEHRLALVDPALFAFDLFAPAAYLRLEFLAQSDELFLTGNDRALSQILGFALAFRDDPLRRFLSGRLRGGKSLYLSRSADASPEKEESRRGDNKGAKRGSENFIHMDLCSTAEWAAG